MTKQFYNKYVKPCLRNDGKENSPKEIKQAMNKTIKLIKVEDDEE